MTFGKTCYDVNNCKYRSADELRDILEKYRGQKFLLDCGHKVTIGHNFGNDIMIRNGRRLKLECSLCSY